MSPSHPQSSGTTLGGPGLGYSPGVTRAWSRLTKKRRSRRKPKGKKKKQKPSPPPATPEMDVLLVTQKLSNPGPIPGSLRRRRQRWYDLKAKIPADVSRVLHNGAPLYFGTMGPPKPRVIRQREFSPETLAILKEFLAEALDNGFIVKCVDRPKVVSPVFVIPKKTPGKFRVIIDLRYVNRFQQVPSFRMGGFKDVAQLVRPGDWMTTTDIQHGFYHVEILPQHQTYLGFQVEGQYYHYKAAPFGSASSPYVFCKALSPLITQLRMEGIRIVVYVDDILVMAESKELCIQHTLRLRQLLTDLGWHVAQDKSMFNCTQTCEFLGMLVDTSGPKPMLRLPYQKKRDVRRHIQKLLAASPAPVSKRVVARVAGLITSVGQAISPAGLLTRNLHRCMKTQSSWDGNLVLDPPALAELEWMLQALKEWDGRLLVPDPSSLVMETDASTYGFGAHIKDSPLQMAGHWSPEERARHINWKELTAVERALHAFQPQLQGQSVLVRSDNVTTVAYLRRMTGRTPHLAEVAMRIFLWAEENNVTISALHLPGENNQTADRLSRLRDLHEWRLRPRSARRLQKLWGKASLDCFASPHNALCPRYFSRFPHPTSAGVDALAQTWGPNENCLLIPPFPLLARTVRKLAQSSCGAILIAPVWPHQPWFHELLQMASQAQKLSPQDFLPDHRGQVYPLRNPHWTIAAFRILPAPERPNLDSPIPALDALRALGLNGKPSKRKKRSTGLYASSSATTRATSMPLWQARAAYPSGSTSRSSRPPTPMDALTARLRKSATSPSPWRNFWVRSQSPETTSTLPLPGM